MNSGQGKLKKIINYFVSQVYVIPPRDLIFFSADLQGNAIIAERMKAFAALYQNEAKGYHHDNGCAHERGSALNS